MLRSNTKIGSIVWFIDYDGKYKPTNQIIKKTKILDIANIYNDFETSIVETNLKRNKQNLYCNPRDLFYTKNVAISFIKNTLKKEIEDCESIIKNEQKHLKKLKDDLKFAENLK